MSESKDVLCELERIMSEYLQRKGHQSIQEWAIVAMGYRYDDDWDVWTDDESQPVDIELAMIRMLDSEGLLYQLDEEVF